MTIAITVGEVADNNVHVTFEPSVADGRYFADVVAAADIAGKSEYEIVVLLQNKYGAEMTDIVRNGKFETDVAVEENKNYVAVAFGYNVAASEFSRSSSVPRSRMAATNRECPRRGLTWRAYTERSAVNQESEPSSIRMIKPLRSKPADLRSRDLRPLWRRLV